VSELFPEEFSRHQHITYDRQGFQKEYIFTRTCQRCGALVADHMKQQHTDWHASVDTAATTQLRGTK
jgi:ribosomal protein S27AE